MLQTCHLQPRGKTLATGQDLLQAFKKDPSLVPRAACPQSVYFLLGLDNFKQAWNTWLGPGLQACEYNVGNILDKYINYPDIL
jgi:hypothetical protein